MSSEICLIAIVQGKPGSGDAIAEALKACALASREEVGCYFYMPHRDLDHADRVVMVERWASRAVLAEHEQTAHYKTLGTVIGPLLAEPVQLLITAALPPLAP